MDWDWALVNAQIRAPLGFIIVILSNAQYCFFFLDEMGSNFTVRNVSVFLYDATEAHRLRGCNWFEALDAHR